MTHFLALRRHFARTILGAWKYCTYKNVKTYTPKHIYPTLAHRYRRKELPKKLKIDTSGKCVVEKQTGETAQRGCANHTGWRLTAPARNTYVKCYFYNWHCITATTTIHPPSIFSPCLVDFDLIDAIDTCTRQVLYKHRTHSTNFRVIVNLLKIFLGKESNSMVNDICVLQA